MPTRALALFLALTLALPAAAAPRRRAVAKPVFDISTVKGWLEKNAFLLTATELVPWSHDLEPLRSMIGGATLVGLGDGTHASHEFYTVKLRMIDFLVREMDFDVIAFEAPFALFERLNQYALGGAGDPRAILAEVSDRFRYFFWDVEEMLAVVEWVRAYNLLRGDAPPVEIAGFDKYDHVGAAAAVIAYLQKVDPAEAARVDSDYVCVRASVTGSFACRDGATAVRDRIAAQRGAYTAASSVREYEDALQYATIVTQMFGTTAPGADRDVQMAANATWIRDHRGRSGKAILWGHQEHTGENESQVIGAKSMGMLIAESIGEDYFTVGMVALNVTYGVWRFEPKLQTWNFQTVTMPNAASTTYESHFRQRGVPALLIPLHGNLPAWLAGPAPYRQASVGETLTTVDALPDKFDALVYIETTTPTKPLP